MTKDPVCGMQVNESTSSAKTLYKGQTYYFCSAVYQSTFGKNPERFSRGDTSRFPPVDGR